MITITKAGDFIQIQEGKRVSCYKISSIDAISISYPDFSESVTFIVNGVVIEVISSCDSVEKSFDEILDIIFDRNPKPNII